MPRRPSPITPSLYKSSNLALPPSPFSPKSPLFPQEHPQSLALVPTASSARMTIVFFPPPASPLSWLWQCHICNSVYRLGTTRRCLEDGHFFCSGTTTVKRNCRTNEKIVRHKACASEFDYRGWKVWGEWRRDAAVIQESLLQEEPEAGLSGEKRSGGAEVKDSPKKDCWNMCDYPSECRWGKLHGIHTPVVATVPSSPSSASTVKHGAAHLFGAADDILSNALEPGNSLVEGSKHLLEQLSTTSEEPDAGNEKKSSIDEVLHVAKRRNRRSLENALPSPLGSNPPSTAPDSVSSSSPKAEEAEPKFYKDREADMKKLGIGETQLNRAGMASPTRRSSVTEDPREAFAKALKLIGRKSSWFG